jgi:riboflavin synthase alpha subunit
MNKKLLTKPLLALAALGVVGAGAGVGALASAQTAGSSSASAQITDRPDRMPGVHGTITAINGTAITITDERENTTYTVDAGSATVMIAAQGSAPTTGSVSSLKVGDKIGVEGTVSGTSVTATKIMSGFMGGHGFGQGGMHERGAMGTVSAINGTTLTITGDNGTTYTVDASSATVSKIVETSVSDISVGDRIGAEGSLSGTTVAAKHIMTGIPQKPVQQ